MSAYRDVAENAARVLDRCREAAVRSARDADAVTLVAACKTQPRERAVAVLEAGVRDLGENRVQEAEEKWGQAPPAGARLHMIGRLQRNKAGRAAALFDLIQSCDSLALARRLATVAAGDMVRVLLEVNVSGEETKAGFSPADLREALPLLLSVEGLCVEGLMTVAPASGDPVRNRPYFAALRDLSEDLRSRHAALGPALSMGMTDDYPVAIDEGATTVRVGRAIYGERPAY